MIDTDKYEGHTPAIGWRKADGSAMSMQTANNDADAELMADAPLLLAEVIRLREELQRVCSHFDYSMTMTGFVCNTCGKEEEE
jgi:hypothetical protein